MSKVTIKCKCVNTKKLRGDDDIRNIDVLEALEGLCAEFGQLMLDADEVCAENSCSYFEMQYEDYDIAKKFTAQVLELIMYFDLLTDEYREQISDIYEFDFEGITKLLYAMALSTDCLLSDLEGLAMIHYEINNFCEDEIMHYEYFTEQANVAHSRKG